MQGKILSKCNYGEKGKIIKIRGEAAIHRYLFKLGIFVGRQIKFEKINLTPLENSIRVCVNGNTFSLEKEVANNVHVEIS